jgi:hypothetical protein
MTISCWSPRLIQTASPTPDGLSAENIFTDLVRALYSADTSTNVLPSIHVLNSLGAYSAIANSERLSTGGSATVRWF